MENASKALIMAGGVLIGILILTLAVYLFITFGAESKEIYTQIEERQLTQYNAQYTIFTDRNDITIYDIISLVNLAKENNEYYGYHSGFENSYKVTISLTGEDVNGNLQNIDEERQQALLEKYSKVSSTTGELEELFSCNSQKVTYHPNGRIKKIVFDH